MINKIKLTWQDIENCVDILANKLNDKKFDAVVSIGRGGMIPARLLAEKFDIHNAYIIDAKAYGENVISFNAANNNINVKVSEINFASNIHNVLVVDDCIFTGATLAAVINKIKENKQIEHITNVFLYKNEHVQNIFNNYLYAKSYDGNTTWLVFPWEKN